MPEIEAPEIMLIFNQKADFTALPDVMRYKNPTPNPLPASDEGAKIYLIKAETAVSTRAWPDTFNRDIRRHLRYREYPV